jgi:hypothetical protein
VIYVHAERHKAYKHRRKITVLTSRFGIEIEFTGITRSEAARVTAKYLDGTISSVGDYYDTKKVIAPDGRVWKLMSDGSISCQKRSGRQKVAATREYSVELVSPMHIPCY